MSTDANPVASVVEGGKKTEGETNLQAEARAEQLKETPKKAQAPEAAAAAAPAPEETGYQRFLNEWFF